MAINLRVIVAACAVVAACGGSIGTAAAQYYPPQPGDYQPPYADRPLYRDANGAPLAEDAYGRLYAPQPLPSDEGQAYPRPPGDVAGGNAADVTLSLIHI